MVGLAGARLKGTVTGAEILSFLKDFATGGIIRRLVSLEDLRKSLTSLPKYEKDV